MGELWWITRAAKGWAGRAVVNETSCEGPAVVDETSCEGPGWASCGERFFFRVSRDSVLTTCGRQRNLYCSSLVQNPIESTFPRLKFEPVNFILLQGKPRSSEVSDASILITRHSLGYLSTRQTTVWREGRISPAPCYLANQRSQMMDMSVPFERSQRNDSKARLTHEPLAKCAIFKLCKI